MYELKISEKQAEVINLACEVFFRIGLGQVDLALELVWMDRIFGMDKDHPVDREEFRRSCDGLKKMITGHGPQASFGVGSKDVPSKSHVAVDIHQVIRHRLYWDKHKDDPNRTYTVNAGAPMKYSEEALPDIKKVS